MKKLLAALFVLALIVTSAEAARPIRFTMSLGDNEQSNYYKGAMAIVEAVKEAVGHGHSGRLGHCDMCKFSSCELHS